MNVGGHCLNWRVLAGLLVAGIGVTLLVAPQALSSVVPLLFVAACPLSMAAMMLFMGKGMAMMGGQAQGPEPRVAGRGMPVRGSGLMGRTDLNYCTQCGATIPSTHPVPRYCAQCGRDLHAADIAVREKIGVGRS